MKLPESFRFIERGWLNSNQVLVLGGDGPVVVDTGHVADTAVTLDHLAAAGVKPNQVKLIVNTHCHWDHLGANQAIQQVSGAKIAAGPQTAEIIAARDRKAMWLDYFGAEINPPPVDIVLRPGSDVQLGSEKFMVLAVPGHAPDAIALFNPRHRLLIGGDVLLAGGDMGILNTAVHGFGIVDEAMATVKMLQKMEIAVALPGHGPMITDVRGALLQLWRRLTTYLRDPAKMAWHLVRRIVMVYLILGNGQPRDALIAHITSFPWSHDYVFRCGYIDPQKLVHDVIDDFINRGLVVVENGRISTRVAR